MAKKETKLNEIMEKKLLAPSITMYKLYVPDIAKKVKAGQFVVIRCDDMAERIPLTVADFDRKKGSYYHYFSGSGRFYSKTGKI